MAQKLDGVAFGYSLAILSGLWMLILGILGSLGYAAGAIAWMQTYHLFFNITFIGVVTGIIEAGIYGFVIGWLLAYFYNRFA